MEASDDVNCVVNYVPGANKYNRAESTQNVTWMARLLVLFDLQKHRNKWINSLSNGQWRRVRIARALYLKPQVLVIDDPFLGLDAQGTATVSSAIINTM